MTWAYYLLESNLYLSIFYGLYLLVLQKETFYNLNRMYLLLTAMLSFTIPFLKIGNLNQLLFGATRQDLSYVEPGLSKANIGSFTILPVEEMLIVTYALIAAFLCIKLFINFYQILALALKAKRRTTEGVVYIELNNEITAFSFFNLLFINPSSEEKRTIIKHEMVHIRQKHSFDILLIEFLKILNWFNPIVWLIQKEIKLLHEYIADDVTTKSDVQKHDYAMFLIQNSFGAIPNYLTNQIFNQSILKRRINMLNKQKSAGRARLKILLTVPIVGGMLLVSTLAFSKDYAMIDLYPEKYSVGRLPENKPENKNRFLINFHYDRASGKSTSLEKRLILLNGKVLTQNNIGLIENYDKMLELNAASAKAKYGVAGSNGAIEFTGSSIKTLAIAPPPPYAPNEVPRPHKGIKADTIKFPAPKQTKDQIKFPPPIQEKRKAKSSALNGRKDQIKFPPPIVEKDPGVAPPPPSSKGKSSNQNSNANKNGQIKFPPPIVVKDAKFPPPPPPSKGNISRSNKSSKNQGQIKFPPPIVKKDLLVPPPPPPVEPVRKTSEKNR